MIWSKLNMKSKKDNILDSEEKFYYIGQIYDLSTVRKRNFFSFIIFVIISIVDDSFGIWVLWTTMLPFCLDAKHMGPEDPSNKKKYPSFLLMPNFRKLRDDSKYVSLKIGSWKPQKLGPFSSLFLMRKTLSSDQKWFLRLFFPLIRGMFLLKRPKKFPRSGEGVLKYCSSCAYEVPRTPQVVPKNCPSSLISCHQVTGRGAEYLPMWFPSAQVMPNSLH